MAFDGIVTHGIVCELNKKLAGGKIEKIYQPENDELVFHIHSKEGKFKLYISCNSSSPRIHLITDSPENPPVPMNFCMLLRKHIQGGRIESIIQREWERIVEIPFSTINELGFTTDKKLIIEIMGKHSNIILVDSNYRILDSIKRVSIDMNRVRQILPGITYEYPPAQDKIPFDKVTLRDLEEICHCTPNKLPKALLSGIQGISPLFAESLCCDIDVSSEHYTEQEISAGKSYTDREISDNAKKIYGKMETAIHNLKTGNLSPCVYMSRDNIPADLHVLPLDILEGVYTKIQFETFSEAAEYFFSNKESSNRIKQKIADLEKSVNARLDKLYLKKQRLSEDILKAENSENLRLYGELLTANLHMCKAGDSSVTVVNYYDGSNISIPLDKRFSASKNAQIYFKMYSKSKTAVKEKHIRLEETQGDIDYLESIALFIANAESTDTINDIKSELVEAGYIRRKKVAEKNTKSKPVPLSYTISDGLKVLVGRNNKENDYLTLKLASSKDLWFHTKNIPGSHVILFTDGREPSESSIFETASIAAYHSKGKSSENVPVDYTSVKYVKKPTGAKPGMVIFTNNRTVYVNPAVPCEDKHNSVF